MEIIQTLKYKLANELPGEEAHFELTSIDRSLRIKAFKENPNPRLSAVCILLFEKGRQLHFVLTKRHEYGGVHSGQVSFPGGKMEERDRDLIYTSLRETEEEIGISMHDVEVLGKLTNVYIPPSGFLVHPYVGWVGNKADFHIDEYEVKRLIEVPVTDLMREEVLTKRVVTAGARGLEMPCFVFEEEIVWGATAMILNEFRHLLKQVLK